MSVYKDNKRGTYYVSYSYKDQSTGKFRHVTKRGFKTKKEAQQWERDNYVSYRTNTDALFTDIAREWERASQASDEVKRKHRECEKKRFSKLSDRPIKSISKADLIEWRADLSESEYSTLTKNSAISFVKGVFRYSNEMYGTPDISTVLKRIKRSNKEIMKEMEVWTPEEFETFLEMVNVRVYRLYFEFLFWTGCRRGEALALQKSDLSDGWATIRYSQKDACDGLTPTKTKQVRRIQLDDKTWNDISPLLTEGKSSYVFTWNGHPLSPTAVRNRFKKAIKLSGVKAIRLHDLRHSHATWLINNGVNIVAVSKRLGHASIQQTLTTYTHLLTETDQNMMGKINSFRENGEATCGTNVSQKPKNFPGESFEKSALQSHIWDKNSNGRPSAWIRSIQSDV